MAPHNGNPPARAYIEGEGPAMEKPMRRENVASILFVLGAVVLGATAPASAQFGRPHAGPAGPSSSPGVPSYNPGVPGQVPSTGFRQGHAQRFHHPHRRTFAAPQYVYPQYAYPQVVYPYGYGFGASPVIVVPQAVFPQRRRGTMENPFYGDLGDPFF